ncbi:MAG TPA: hypothetical protein P5141_11020, partial [Candidatus Hydrogenedentes bacterium]|nr:hypothetical protein [Candidatus Hydrogenedentota bacterium]
MFPRFPVSPSPVSHGTSSEKFSVRPEPAAGVIPRRHKGLFCLIAGCYLAISLWHIGRPGLNYDEAYPASLAMKLVHPELPLQLAYGKTTRFFGRFMIVQPSALHGPSRVYLAALWASFFPTDTVSLRLLGVVLGAWALWMLFLLASRWFGSGTGLLVTAMLAVDPTYVLMLRHDIHFNALGLCLRLIALGLAARLWAGVPWRRDGWKLALVILLGTWTSVEFLWFVGGLFAALAVVGRGKWSRWLPEKGWWLWLVLPLAMWAAFFAYAEYITPEPLLPASVRRVFRVLADFRIDEGLKRLR